MPADPITHISLNLGPSLGGEGFLVGLRVVLADRNGNEVYGRTLNESEPDDGKGITLKVGDRLIYPEGSLRITLKDVDKYAQVGPDGYAPITNTVWTWLQIPPRESNTFLHYMLALARRLDQAHALYDLVMQDLDSSQEGAGILGRNHAFKALSDSESMCLALSRAVRMIVNAADKVGVTTSVPSGLQAIEEAATAIRDAFEHIDERALGVARRETPADALSIFDQGDLVSRHVLSYAGHSLNLPVDVLPHLVEARQFLYDAIKARGDTKILRSQVDFGATTEDFGISPGDHQAADVP